MGSIVLLIIRSLKKYISPVMASWGYSSRGFSLWCVGFSLRWLLSLPLGTQASVVAALGLYSLDSVTVAHGPLWDLPGPGIKPVSVALQGGFLTTGPPGKPVGSQLSTSTLKTSKNQRKVALFFCCFNLLRVYLCV